MLDFAQAENLSFHQAKDVLAKQKNHLQDPEPITSWSTQPLPSTQCASPINASPPDPTDPQIKALWLEVFKLQREVNSLKNKLVKYTPLDVTAKMQENISSTTKLYVNLKTSLDSIVPAMIRRGLKGHKREVFLQQLATINP
ncbi:Uncharacterized protein APZ42_014711 [Daphnia magna]|uniref:Uncharacterized protein n=1 Tax=Daphnia magna TaxID=35525 RepID=A0A162PN56_9CRUS|nr:Uncharacterized protein APZ42_014711 [Daphnia magna]